jgi:hypothetical protein
MTRITSEMMERTIIGLGGETAEDQRAVFGLPTLVPRAGRSRLRSALRFFESAIDDIVFSHRAVRRVKRNTLVSPSRPTLCVVIVRWKGTANLEPSRFSKGACTAPDGYAVSHS